MNVILKIIFGGIAVFICTAFSFNFSNYKYRQMDDFELHQDTLRNWILNQKENTVLKESILQEHYIRDIVHIKNDSLQFLLNFDLHSFDCSAPDCYSTEVSMQIPFSNHLVFPQKVNFKEIEKGCISSNKSVNSSFELIEVSDFKLIYHCRSESRTLIPAKTRETFGSFAFYFTNLTLKNFNRDIRSCSNIFNLEESISPCRCTTLETFEYDWFLPQN